MLQRMAAEILFLDPSDMKPGIAALGALGFEDFRVLDWADPYGPTVWITCQFNTELDQCAFLNWATDIVEPLHGDVVEAGLAHLVQASVNRKV